MIFGRKEAVNLENLIFSTAGGGSSFCREDSVVRCNVIEFVLVFCAKRGRRLYYDDGGNFLACLVLIMELLCVLHYPFAVEKLVLKSDWLM